MIGAGLFKVTACALAAFVTVSFAGPASAGPTPEPEPTMPSGPRELLERVPLSGVEPQRYSMFLEGDSVVPGPGDPDVLGFAELTQPQGVDELCYFLVAYNQPEDAEEEVTSAGIYQGVSGQAGPLVLDLPIPVDNLESCVPVDPATLAAFATDTAGYYVQFSTGDFPNGSVRAQLEGYAVAGLTFQPTSGLPGSAVEVRPDTPCEGSTASVAVITAPDVVLRNGSVIIAVRLAEPLVSLGRRIHIKFVDVPVTPEVIGQRPSPSQRTRGRVTGRYSAQRAAIRLPERRWSCISLAISSRSRHQRPSLYSRPSPAE